MCEVVIFMHGGSGVNFGGMRMCRMLAGAGHIVIVPDRMAACGDVARVIQPCPTREAPVDYWDKATIAYADESMTGSTKYSTNAALMGAAIPMRSRWRETATSGWRARARSSWLGRCRACPTI